jgi:hypothetical protein
VNKGYSPGPTRVLDQGYGASVCPLVAHYQPLAVGAVEHVKQVVYLALGHQPAEEPCRDHLVPPFFAYNVFPYAYVTVMKHYRGVGKLSMVSVGVLLCTKGCFWSTGSNPLWVRPTCDQDAVVQQISSVPIHGGLLYTHCLEEAFS